MVPSTPPRAPIFDGFMSNFVVSDKGVVLNRTAAAEGRVPLAAWDIGTVDDVSFLSSQGTSGAVQACDELTGELPTPKTSPGIYRDARPSPDRVLGRRFPTKKFCEDVQNSDALIESRGSMRPRHHPSAAGDSYGFMKADNTCFASNRPMGARGRAE